MDEKLKSHFLNIFCMTAADDNVDPRELETMFSIGEKDYGLTKQEIEEAIVKGNTAFYKPETFEERVRYLYDLALIAWADKKLEDSERIFLKKYALKFDVNEEKVDEFVDFLLEKAKLNRPVEEIIKECC